MKEGQNEEKTYCPFRDKSPDEIDRLFKSYVEEILISRQLTAKEIETWTKVLSHAMTGLIQKETLKFLPRDRVISLMEKHELAVDEHEEALQQRLEKLQRAFSELKEEVRKHVISEISEKELEEKSKKERYQRISTLRNIFQAVVAVTAIVGFLISIGAFDWLIK
jgi:hypothetical protein